MGSKKAVATILIGILAVFSLTTEAFSPVRVSACGIFDIFSCFTDFVGDSIKDARDNSTNNSQSLATALQAVNSPGHSEENNSGGNIVGGSLLEAATHGPNTGPDSTFSGDQISLYVVHKGDTLPDIAKMFGVSVNTIAWANDIKNGKIQVGQTLVILPISGISHTVKSGETLQSIAKQHRGDLNEILAYNDLTKDSKLSVGDIIIVPDGEVSPVISSSGSSKYSNSGVGTKGQSYPVYEGYYMRPIIGGIKTQGVHGHNGVDLSSSYGSKIMASASGTVIVAKSGGWNGGYGSYVVINHSNGTQTLYGHLSEVDVLSGDYVEQGEMIGRMGSSGNSTGTHLHFEIRGARNPF